MPIWTSFSFFEKIGQIEIVQPVSMIKLPVPLSFFGYGHFLLAIVDIK